MKVFRSALQSIRHNGLRSVLAGFGIAWGIFLLIIFLGIGNGFRDGVMELFNAYAQKSLFVYAGQASMAGKGVNKQARILFDELLIDEVQRRYGAIIACSPEMSAPSVSVTYAGESVTALVRGVRNDYFDIKILKIRDGRSINRFDDLYGRNVAIIGEGIRESLFGKQDGVDKHISLDGNRYKVVGILSSDDIFSVQERNSVYIPASSYSKNIDSNGKISSFCLSLASRADAAAIERDMRGFLSFRYGFDSQDEQAVYIANIETQTVAFESLFSGIEVLIWIVGICLLLSGIVGVCNVMLIIVKDRTREIGIRKAVGATSGSVISMILAESVTITLVSGLAGIAMGALAVLISDKVILPLLNMEVMGNLRISLPAVVAAFILLCFSGVVAGLFPALKASWIMPVDAIRYENIG